MNRAEDNGTHAPADGGSSAPLDPEGDPIPTADRFHGVPPAAVSPDLPNAPRPVGPSGRSRWGPRIAEIYRRLLGLPLLNHRLALPIGLGGAVLLFSVAIGWVWSTRYWAFETAAWDLGAYHQAMYTTLFDHRFFYYTNDLPAGTHGYLFASHFSPILAVLLPFYALAPTPSGLLVLQAVGLALGAVPVFFLARARLGRGAWPALFSAIYLLSPLTIGTGWYDFHPEAFLPVCGLTAIYCYERRRFLPFVGSWLLTLSVIEAIAPLLALFAGIGLVALALGRPRPDRAEARLELRFLATGLGLALAWLALAAAVLYSLSPTGGTFGPGYGQAWSILGAPTIADVYPRALLSPASAGAALAHDAGLKALYVVLVLGGVGFLSLFGRRRYLLPTLAWIGLALLSNHVGYFVLNDQYTGYVLPFLFPAAITGVEWWRRLEWRPYRTGLRAPAIAAILVVALVGSSAVASPFLPHPYGSFNAVPHGFPTVTSHDEELHALIGLIPSTAGVLTTSLLFPEVSNRSDAYVIPISSYFTPGLSFESVVGSYVNESRYVLMDFVVDNPGATLLYRTANLSGFGLEAAAGGAYLYERGYVGAPRVFLPFEVTIAGGHLRPPHPPNDRFGVVDPTGSTSYGPTLLHEAGTGTGALWLGPALEDAPPGRYEASAHLTVTSSSPGPVGSFAIVDTPILVNETITPLGAGGRDYGFTFAPAPGAPTVLTNQSIDANGTAGVPLSLNLTSTFPWLGPGFLQTEGWVGTNGATVRLLFVTITQLEGP